MQTHISYLLLLSSCFVLFVFLLQCIHVVVVVAVRVPLPRHGVDAGGAAAGRLHLR